MSSPIKDLSQIGQEVSELSSEKQIDKQRLQLYIYRLDKKKHFFLKIIF